MAITPAIAENPATFANNRDVALVGRAPVRGRILSAEGTPVAAATVSVVDAVGAQIATAVSGVDGYYSVHLPVASRYVLIVAGAGADPAAVAIEVGRDPLRQDVTLAGVGSLAGVVRGAHGLALEGALVTVVDGQGSVVATAHTDSSGVFAAAVLPAGRYTVMATAPGFAPAAVGVTVSGESIAEVTVVLPGALTLRGAVTGDRGDAVGDALVRIFDRRGVSVARTRTDAAGQYEVAGLCPGEYSVVAQGYPPRTSDVNMAVVGEQLDVSLAFPAAVCA